MWYRCTVASRLTGPSSPSTRNVQSIPADSVRFASACSALKVKAAQAGRLVSHESVQLHGGIGMSDELIVGHLLKRLPVAAV